MATYGALVDTATISKYEKGYADLTTRSRLLPAMLQRRGRMMYNCSGTDRKWYAMISLARAKGYANGQTLEYGSTQPNIEFSMDYRGMYTAESLGLMDMMINRDEGGTQIIDIWQQKANIVMEGMKQDFFQEFFNAGSDTSLPQGIESCLTARTTPGAGDRVAEPSVTYMGKSTALASQGGTWSDSLTTQPNSTLSNDWPDGRGRPEYDCTSPKLVNTTSTAWTGTATWQANAWRVVDQAKTWMSMLGDNEYAPDLCQLSPDMWTGFRNNQEAKTHLLLPHKEATDLGFPDTLNMDGLAIRGSDFDIPPQTGYILNLKSIDLCCMFDVLFKLITGEPGNSTVESFLKSKGFDIDSLSNRIVSLFLGNWRFRPRYIAKLYPYA
jgi:hypothetical protein